MHELDLFSTLIWVLKMHKETEYAEFKAIYVYGARTEEDGLFEGIAICQDDNEDVSQLMKEIQKEKEAQKLKEERKIQFEAQKENK